MGDIGDSAAGWEAPLGAGEGGAWRGGCTGGGGGGGGTGETLWIDVRRGEDTWGGGVREG